MSISKYFTKAELECPLTGECKMDEAFLHKLDEMRERYGSPVYVSSGFRSQMGNRKIGGHPRSLHMKGQAIDIPMTDPYERWSLVYAAMSVGLGVEVCDRHVHVEYREGRKPKLWSGISK